MKTETKSKTLRPELVLLAIVLVKLALHLVPRLWSDFGIFRDELYYLACADRLAWGYVDQPPLSVFTLASIRALFGDSLFVLRLFPAMLGAIVVWLCGRMARAMGGGGTAVTWAALASLISGAQLAYASVWSMNVLDLLLASLAYLILIRILNEGRPFDWLALGTVLGLGLLNKVGMVWIGLGILIGLLATRERRWLKTVWPWIGGIIAWLLFLPYLIWNYQNDWAHLAFIESAVSGKYSGLSPWSFLSGQLFTQNPLNTAIWIGGLIWLLSARQAKTYRPLAWIWITACLVLVANGQSKPGYLSPAYPLLFAAGGVAWERWLQIGTSRTAMTVLLSFGLLAAPFATPLLPAATHIRYAGAAGVLPSTDEGHELVGLSQFYADMFGWKEKAEAVSEVFHALPEEERQVAVLFAHNYGRAGALEYWADDFDLPPTISNHNSYWLWGPGESHGDLLIVLGGDREDLESRFESVELAGRADCSLCIPYERDLPIFVCRRSLLPMEELWPLTKSYN